ncbi:hypothetical protein AJ79_03491 [Helicocarpus griseus UAMH5409]|uniref:Uncharacterized protein n=1 Tax=Helicocarpus griseus UAMH5409 TaxID=1447875 RepID=A0A2B7XXY6_9EURO|nr:hypothetical protein AJ79_03491 [Helicocarpus griseus UAMH5409]
MAAPSDSPVPDLASVLKTLSAYAPAASGQQGVPLNRSVEDPGHNSYNGATSLPNHAPQTQNPPPIDNSASLPDPSTITAWPAALKYVMKTVAQSETTQYKIRRLIRSQHDHEKQWWEGRRALLVKQEGRSEKRKQLDEVLRSVGGMVAKNSDGPTPEDDKKELDTYDKKVHKALKSMSKALDAELRGLGIPFFAIQHKLVESPSTPTLDTEPSAALTPDQLTALQLRMLQLLEDLCKE